MNDVERGAHVLRSYVDIRVGRREGLMQLDGKRLISGFREAALFIQQSKEAHALLKSKQLHDLWQQLLNWQSWSSVYLLEEIQYDLVVLKGDQVGAVQLDLLIQAFLNFQLENVFGEELMKLLVCQVDAHLRNKQTNKQQLDELQILTCKSC